MMWKNIVQQGRPQMAIWRTRIACRIPKATNTHSEYVILIAFPRQQWLCERVTVLRYSCTACAIWKIFNAEKVKKLKFFMSLICTISWVYRARNAVGLFLYLSTQWPNNVPAGFFKSASYSRLNVSLTLGSIYFPEIRRNLKLLGAIRVAGMKQFPCCGPTNVSRHRTKFCRPGDLAPLICSPVPLNSTPSSS